MRGKLYKLKGLFYVLNIIGDILLVGSFVLFFLIRRRILPWNDIRIEILGLTSGIGFFMLFPLSYYKANEERERQGKIDYTYLSYSGKYLLFGVLLILVSLIIFLKSR